MGLYPANIHIGAARIFLNVTAPATGNPPTKLPINADGTPTTGIEVGYTQGATNFMYKAEKQEVEAEQSLNPVAVFTLKEEATIEFTAMEHVYNTLKTAFDNINSLQSADDDFFWGGDASGLVDVTTQCVALTSRIRTATGKFEILCLYNVYNVEGMQIGYNRTAPATYKVTLKALVDPLRQEGDRVFQFRRQRPAGGFASASASTSPSASVSPSASASVSVSPSASVSPS